MSERGAALTVAVTLAPPALGCHGDLNFLRFMETYPVNGANDTPLG